MNDLLSSFRLLFFQYLKQMDNAEYVNKLACISEENGDYANARQLQDQSSELYQTVRFTKDRIKPYVSELLSKLKEIETTLSANQILTDDLIFCQTLYEFVHEQKERFDTLPISINFLNLLANELDQIYTILASIEKKVSIGLEKIFKDGYFDLCKMLFNEFDIIDKNGIVLIKTGTVLFAVMSAIKDCSDRILIRNYTDEELLSYFNSYLGREFKQLKRDGKYYSETTTKAKNIIQAFKLK